jgi:hypothetical protein
MSTNPGSIEARNFSRKPQSTGRVQFTDLLREGLANSLHALQLICGDQTREFGLLNRFQCARPRLISTHLEGIFALANSISVAISASASAMSFLVTGGKG